jgi:hypothetical protein
MCSNTWNAIQYQGVPSKCMNLRRNAFRAHDEKRFQAFLEDVKTGKKEIKSKQLFPHEISKYYMTADKEDDVVELQWKELVKEAAKLGSFHDSLVLSDVSGSMSGTPMEVSVALGLLISEVVPEPFKNLVITFSENPVFHSVKGTTLKERVKDIMAMPWGGTTNFQAVFDLMLSKATQSSIPKEAMPKRLFVLSDMQFDAACGQHKWMTSHQIIQEKYKAAGYPMPDIVYWNLRAAKMALPVTGDQKGVALLSGFSPNVLTALVSGKDIKEAMNPMQVLKNALANDRYSKLTL